MLFRLKKNPRECRSIVNMPQHNKSTYEKPTKNNIQTWKKLEAIALKSGMRHGCPLSSTPFQHYAQSTTWRQ